MSYQFRKPKKGGPAKVRKKAFVEDKNKSLDEHLVEQRLKPQDTEMKFMEAFMDYAKCGCTPCMENISTLAYEHPGHGMKHLEAMMDDMTLICEGQTRGNDPWAKLIIMHNLTNGFVKARNIIQYYDPTLEWTGEEWPKKHRPE